MWWGCGRVINGVEKQFSHASRRWGAACAPWVRLGERRVRVGASGCGRVIKGVEKQVRGASGAVRGVRVAILYMKFYILKIYSPKI